MKDFDDISGGPNSDPVSWIRHLLIESKRLGEHVREESQHTQDGFKSLREDFFTCQTGMRDDVNNLRSEILDRINRLEQQQVTRMNKLENQQAVLATEMKLKIAGISAVVSGLTTVVMMLLKSGIFQ
jgi:hypothetical protein